MVSEGERNVLAILSLGIGLCVQYANAASAENLFVRVSSFTPALCESSMLVPIFM